MPNTARIEKDSEQSEALVLLKGIGIRADVAAELAGHAPEQIKRLIAQVRSRPTVRDAAAWVVGALRVLPLVDETPAVPPKVSDRPIVMHPGISGLDRQRWLTRFRNAEPAERPEILARFLHEHPQSQDAEDQQAYNLS